ncbi:hypothetical protein [Corynebacterium sp. H130]|uniref:hypothetical protein n=1 Tax=Corynebacterium sp. H130 TaxID=3133444 RepID=UPI0030A6B602
MSRYVIAFLQLVAVVAFLWWTRFVFTVDAKPGSFFHDAEPSFLFTVGFVLLICTLSVLGRFYPTNVARYWKDGRVGVGTVRSYQRLGLKKNVRSYELKMQVEGEDGALFDGTLVVPVGRRRLGALHQGLRLPVIYREKKPAKLFVPHGPFTQRAQLFYDFLDVRDGRVDQHTLNAGYFGQPARAVIVQEMSDGLVFPGKERLHFTVNVFTPDGRQFPAEATLLADKYEKGLLHKARYVEAKYLPEAPERVALRIPKAPKVG